MTDLIAAIPAVRDSIVAVLRLRLTLPSPAEGHDRPMPQDHNSKRSRPGAEVSATEDEPPRPQLQWSFGSAFCIVEDRYLLTAHHVLSGGKAREPGDRFYALAVPGNSAPAFHFPVVAFPLERADLDLAVLEIGPCATPGTRLPALPVSFARQPDGTRALTMGYPAPLVSSLSVNSVGEYQGGQLFLKSHANEGIVAAQYDQDGALFYELNVGWHHGESGGPVVSVAGEPAAFSIMQQYRNIQSPHGVVAGPHRGRALSAIASELRELGVGII